MQTEVEVVVPQVKLRVTVDNWGPAREVFRQFLNAHPELNLRFSENTYQNFTRLVGPTLEKADVMRKPGLRAPWLADINRFDEYAFAEISRMGYKARAEESA